MPEVSWLNRLRKIDVRAIAAFFAALFLIVGVMWVVPTTPDSNSFTFDSARRDISAARLIEFGKLVEGRIVDGSDADFYRTSPLRERGELHIRMTNGSTELIPAVRIYYGQGTLLAEKAEEYLKSPGANIEHSFAAEANVTYYIQIASQRNTTGPYTLIVTVDSL